MLSRSALRVTMPALAILLAAPVAGVRAGLLQRGQDLAGKTVIADGGHGSLDPCFIPGMPHTSRVHLKTAHLRVLEKRQRHVRRERIRLGNDGLGVIGNENFENALKELPGGFAGLDGAHGGFFESGIHKPIARAHGGKDPSAKAPTLLR